MAREEALIVRRESSPAKKPKGKGPRKALFSDVEDPRQRLRLTEKYWRRKVESMNRKDTAGADHAVEIVAAANEEIAARKRQLLAIRSQEARRVAESPATLAALIDKGDEMPFATALSQVGRRERDGVYAIAVQACLGAAMGKTLKRLIELDDTPGKRMSREAIVKIDETDPDMFAVAVQSLPAASLALIADEATLGVCSPKQLSSLIGMAAGKMFVGSRGRGAASEAGAEKQQQTRVSLGRLLDQVIERDAAADLADDPDFGFAETVMERLSAESLARMKKSRPEPPTFTVCKLVELADRKRESAETLVELLNPEIVAAARKVLAELADFGKFSGEDFPDQDNQEYFSIG